MLHFACVLWQQTDLLISTPASCRQCLMAWLESLCSSGFKDRLLWSKKMLTVQVLRILGFSWGCCLSVQTPHPTQPHHICPSSYPSDSCLIQPPWPTLISSESLFLSTPALSIFVLQIAYPKVCAQESQGMPAALM